MTTYGKPGIGLLPRATALALGLMLPLVPPGRVRCAEIEYDGPLAPDAMHQIMEQSEVRYAVGPIPDGVTPETIVDLLWPPRDGVAFPWIEKKEDGGRSLLAFPFSDEENEELRRVETPYQAGQYAVAAEEYEKIARAYPKNYIAISSIGDCHYFRGDFKAALRYYERALEMNPYHYLNYLKLGNALVKLGKHKKAIEAYIGGLAARPRQETLLLQLRYHADELKIRVDDSRFLPRGYAEQTEDGVSVYSDLDAGWHWLPYAECKAIWLGEADYRARRLDDEDAREEHSLTSTEESDCLKVLFAGYSIAREEGEVELDPMLDRLSRIVDAGMLDEFVIYELFSRFAPDVALLVPREKHGLDLRKYIETFVITRKRRTRARSGS